MNKVRIQGRIFTATPIAATQEDHFGGIATLWDLTDAEGHVSCRGLVQWFEEAGGGWGYWPRNDQPRVRVETPDVEWLEVEDGMRRWLKFNGLRPCRLDIIEGIAREELKIETLKIRGNDELDFQQISVANLRAALEQAFDQGRASKQ